MADTMNILGVEVPWARCLMVFDTLILLLLVVIVFAGYKKAQKDAKAQAKREAKAAAGAVRTRAGMIRVVRDFTCFTHLISHRADSIQETKAPVEAPAPVEEQKVVSPKAAKAKAVVKPTTPKSASRKIATPPAPESDDESPPPATTPKKRVTKKKAMEMPEELGHVLSPEGRRSSRLMK
jgi:hypothetical protein